MCESHSHWRFVLLLLTVSKYLSTEFISNVIRWAYTSDESEYTKSRLDALLYHKGIIDENNVDTQKKERLIDWSPKNPFKKRI